MNLNRPFGPASLFDMTTDQTPHPLLEFRNVEKSYETRRVLCGIDLTVASGESLACLGANGSGKSSLIRLGLGLGRPDAGQVLLFGQTHSEHHHRQLGRVGVAFDELGMQPDLSLAQNLQMHAGLHGFSRAQALRASQEVLERFELLDHAKARPGELSRGISKRAGLARALLHKPEFLILDEPFSGLDPNMVQKMLALLSSIQQSDRTTMLITSHNLGVVRQCCSRIVIIHKGRVAVDRPSSHFPSDQSLEKEFHEHTVPI